MTLNLERGLSWAIDIANDNRHGYSQTNRLGKDFDCSSFVSMILVISGAIMPANCTTYNIKPYLEENGFRTTLDNTRKRGDIFLNTEHHVVMCLNENDIVHASGVNKGILIEPFYEPSFKYTYHYRYQPSDKTRKDIAYEVIAGLWGNYPERKELLEKAGWNYEEIQNEVNSILGNYVG